MKSWSEIAFVVFSYLSFISKGTHFSCWSYYLWKLSKPNPPPVASTSTDVDARGRHAGTTSGISAWTSFGWTKVGLERTAGKPDRILRRTDRAQSCPLQTRQLNVWVWPVFQIDNTAQIGAIPGPVHERNGSDRQIAIERGRPQDFTILQLSALISIFAACIGM